METVKKQIQVDVRKNFLIIRTIQNSNISLESGQADTLRDCVLGILGPWQIGLDVLSGLFKPLVPGKLNLSKYINYTITVSGRLT